MYERAQQITLLFATPFCQFNITAIWPPPFVLQSMEYTSNGSIELLKTADLY
jgi:hypothetical protein